MKINSGNNITPRQTGRNSSDTLNTQISSQPLKKIKYSSVSIIKRKKLASSSKKFKKHLEKHINTRVKRADDKVDNNLVKATKENDYNYWLSQEDIADIARLKYQRFQTVVNYDNHFEIIGSFPQLKKVVKKFIERIKANIAANTSGGTVLTLIINPPSESKNQPFSNHWTSLVIYRELNHNVGIYLDSKSKAIPDEYQSFFSRNDIELVNLTKYFIQQQDDCNCGLWALENAADINLMLHNQQDQFWAFNQIKRTRDKNYFNIKRRELAEILASDLDWRNRHPNYQENNSSPEPSSSSDPSSRTSPENEPAFKRCKIYDKKDIFIDTFTTEFSQRLAAYHLTAREGRITVDALRSELLIGTTGCLLGAIFSQCIVANCMGALPSIVGSTRAISAKLLIKKKSARRITKCFDEVEKGSLSKILYKAAWNIFCNFEYQFTRITDKAGSRVAMQKLADDAVDRVMNYLKQHNPTEQMSTELLEKALLQGRSESYFDPDLGILQLKVKGKTLVNDKFENFESKVSICSSRLYENVGLVVFENDPQLKKFYESRKHQQKFGYRRLFDWEKDSNGDLKEELRPKYSEYFPHGYNYDYLLTQETSQAEVQQMLDKVESKLLPVDVPAVKEKNKESIFFNLREPVADFTGREESIRNLHDMLANNRNMAVISPSLIPSSTATADKAESIRHHTAADASMVQGSQLSISGLGGIGKTQLALQYAKLYAQDYDNNILWINAESLESLDSSFIKLASKLQLETKNRYGHDKEIDEIVEMVYEHFNDKKSLFIFDNAEDFRGIEVYLPKSMLGNKPTVLITSRFSNWRNVATVLSLDVFTDQEALALFKKTLGNNNQEYQIFSLNKMLQGLPLALNQAIAYIQFQRETDPEFSLDQYIDLFKIKAELLLTFNLEYNNDPYLKTVFTTWLVTLDKIRMIPELGPIAIEILDHTIYLDPENIAPPSFYPLKDLHNLAGDYIYDSFSEYTDRIKKAMFLLKSYSLLNAGTDGGYVMHRLVQQVHRINIEKDPIKFEKIVKDTQLLFIHQNDQEDDSHYLHFLLYMAEHENSTELLLDNCIKRLFVKLANKEIKYWFYFLDLAYHKFTRKRYLEFLADSLAFCRKEGFISLVTEMLNYFEDQYELANFTLEDIVDMFSRIEYSKEYEVLRFSPKPEKQKLQKEAIRLIAELKKKLFGNYHNYNACASSRSSKKKRNICSDEEQQEWLEKIEYETSKSHVEKLSLVSHYVNTGLLTKDILSALCRGEWKEVAVNLEFILGSEILGKVSNRMLIQGSQLEAEAHLLEKELGIENPKIWSLLLNEEVTFIGKKLFLGKVLQIAGTFVSSSTDLLAIYNLKQAIEAYQKGDKTVVPDIVGTSVISINGAAGVSLSAAAVLGFVERSTARLINPYLAALSTLAWLGTSVYKTEMHIEAIQKYVYLSAKEHYIEFMRSFLNYQPSSYLQAKSNNEQLVLHALDFLKNHTDFRWYIAPIFSADNVALLENSTVLLDHKRTLLLSTATPDEPSEGHLACLPGVPEDNQSNSHFAYLCSGAFGLEYLLNRTAEIVLVNLGAGNDTAFGIPDFPNYFLVQNGKKNYMGGDEGNIFRLESNATTGRLTGGKKSDALILEQFNSEEGAYLLIDNHRDLCVKKGMLEDFDPLPCLSNSIELNKINQIYGRRKQQDVIYLDQDFQFIDGYGGYDKEHPDIFIAKSYRSSLVLRNNTLVLISLTNTIQSIDYQIPAMEIGEAEIRTNFSATIKHRFFFNAILENILCMKVQNDTLTVSVFVEDDTDVSTFTIKLFDPNFLSQGQPHFKNVTNFEKHSSYFFENMELKLVNNEQLFGQEILSNNKTLEEKIDRFSTLARYLEKTLTIQLLNNDTLAIGGRSHDYFSIDGSSVSHLIGNGGENVYLIIPPKKDVLFPLAEITLYASPSTLSDSNEQFDTLDLCAVTDYLKKNCPQAVISSNLSLEGDDLILVLTSYIRAGRRCTDVNTTWNLAYIRLKDGIYWYKKIDILLEDKIAQHITTVDGENWTLTGPSLIFKEYKNIINLMPSDMGENSEIVLLRNSGNYSFFRNESDLILTNVHTATPLTECTIIAHGYYQDLEMQRKLLSSKLSFLDEDSFHLKDNQALIDEAQHFSNFAKLLESKDNFKHKHELHIPVLIKPSQELPKLRYKRQIDSVPNGESTQVISLGIKMGIGIGLVVSGVLSLRLYNKCRNFPIENISLQAIVITGLSLLKKTDAQEQNTLVTETPLDFQRGFSIENNCLTAETPLGWTAVCQNHRRILYLKTDQNVSSLYFESYQMNSISLQRVGEGVWKNNLTELTSNALAEEIYPLLPPHWQEQFMEKKTQQQVLAIWKQRALISVTQSLSDRLILHTPVGDLFKTLGLSPDWKAREDRYFLNRCWFAFDQPLYQTNLMSNVQSLGLISAELALLHPSTQRLYTALTQGDVSKAKFVIRFVADVLQLGFYNICHLAHILEYCFPSSESVKNIGLGLRMASYFYFLTDDLNYWHLGLALFFLPQVPQLLDHLGIPATRGLQKLSIQLSQVLMGSCLLKMLPKDEARIEQENHELIVSDMRVKQARKRLKNFANSSVIFFSTNEKANDDASSKNNYYDVLARMG